MTAQPSYDGQGRVDEPYSTVLRTTQRPEKSAYHRSNKTSRPGGLAINPRTFYIYTAITAERSFQRPCRPRPSHSCPTSVYSLVARDGRARSNPATSPSNPRITRSKAKSSVLQQFYLYASLRVMPCPRPHFVFACFKCIERWGNWITGAAGPFFVASATLLFVLGTLCFRMSFKFFMPFCSKAGT